jgi:uncharacterized protein
MPIFSLSTHALRENVYNCRIKINFMLHARIKEEIKNAMRAKEQLKLDTLRGMLTAFTNELVATRRTPQEMLSDEEALAVVKRLAKQRKDSIEQFTKGGRPELAEKEAKELAIIEGYLPTMMGRADIEKIAEAKKTELGVTDKSGLGKLIGAVMKECKGAADGSDVKAVVESLL